MWLSKITKNVCIYQLISNIKKSNKKMQESDHIVILPKELAQVGRRQYAQIEQDNAEEMDEQVEYQTSVSIGRERKEKERKGMRWRKVVSFVVFVVLASAVAYVQYQAATMEKDPLLQTDKKNIKRDRTIAPKNIKNDTQQAQMERNSTVQPSMNQTKPQPKQTVVNNTVKQQQSKSRQNHKTTNRTRVTPQFIPVPNEFYYDKENVLHRPTNEHEVHLPETYSYPTLGMRKPGQTFNRTAVSIFDYHKYEERMDAFFKPYNNTDCKLKRYGDIQDGGYLLCTNFLNHSQALLNLGVEGRDAFGCDISTAALIPNFQYDCTNYVAPKCQKNSNLNDFQAICLGQRTQKSQGKQFYSLKDMLDSRNLTKRHVSMKIDVQGAQWPGLRSFPFEYLDYIDQFVFQIHLQSGTINYQPMWGNLDILDSLAQKFASVSLHMNNHACIMNQFGENKMRFYPAFAIQVTLVNRDILTIHDETRSYWLHPEHHPNRFGKDCQLHD